MSPEHPHDRWLVNGSPDFGVIPGGTIASCVEDTPIHLFRGDTEWGWTHITHKHGQQRLFKYLGSVEELVWLKCSEHGDIHSVIEHPDKLTITITVAPTAFLVLKYNVDSAVSPSRRCTADGSRIPRPSSVVTAVRSANPGDLSTRGFPMRSAAHQPALSGVIRGIVAAAPADSVDRAA
jgi:hypothetical protein